MRLSLSIVALALAAPTGLQAQAGPDAQAAPTDEKKICQTEKMTGSLTRVRRICLTRAEWEDLRLRTKHSFEDNIRGAAGGKECVLDGNGGCK
jgi:hypothetical protein